jgi:hypothetical protein
MAIFHATFCASDQVSGTLAFATPSCDGPRQCGHNAALRG